jgi:hypothetical protein
MDKINSLNLSLDRLFIQLNTPGIISIFPFCIYIHQDVLKFHILLLFSI